MTETTVPTPEVKQDVAKIEGGAQTTVKTKSKRGIGGARGASTLKFSHEHAKQNGLFVAHLNSVTVKMITIGEESTGMPTFNGMEIPRITFTFVSNEEEPNRRKHVNLSFTAVESNAENIPGGKGEWKVNGVLDWLKHILDVFVLKGKDMTEEQEELLSLDYEDFDEEGKYVPVDSEEVIKAWTKLFMNFADIMNNGNNGEPYYQSKNGKPIPLWIKLIRYFKTKKSGWKPVSNGELAFQSFVGEGAIEIYSNSNPPTIRLNAISEAIKPMQIEEAKTPNMGAMGIPGVSGVAVDTGIPASSIMGGISAQAAEDMPF